MDNQLFEQAHQGQAPQDIGRPQPAIVKLAESKSNHLTYRHTQKAPWYLLLYALAGLFLAVGWCVHAEFPLEAILLATGFFMILLGASFQRLTVEDEGNQLAIRFGPFPLFRKRIWYEDIVEVGKDRMIFGDSWGIHWSPWGGWVWSIRGRDCVRIRRKRGIIRIGTDDLDGLTEFLNGRISTHDQALGANTGQQT